MKFHCERCKTKYSISDDRVRGKILKIRCKNCSSVITVREPKSAAPAVPAAAKRTPSAAARKAAKPAQAKAVSPAAKSKTSSAGQAALAGAFKQAVNDPSSSAANMKASASPVSLEAEWYLSKDGKQEGPFTMEEAHAWVSAKPPEDELYCWSEGFDDWLPTEKISHFRGIRVSSFSDLDSPDEQTMIDGPLPFLKPVDTPKPLFAATMEAVANNESVALDDEVHLPSKGPAAKPAVAAPPIPGKAAGPAAAAAAPKTSLPAKPAAAASPMFAPAPASSSPAPATPATAASAPSADLAIGEASRVVDLAALMANRGNAPSNAARAGGLPGTTRPLGNGTGMGPALGGTAGGLPGMSASAAPQLAPLGGLGTQRKKRSSLLLILIGASVFIALGAALLVYLMSGDDEEDRIARGSVGGSGNLGYSFNDNRPEAKGTKPVVEPPPATTEEVEPTGKGTQRRKPIGGPRTPRITTKNNGGNKNGNSGEVDLTKRTETPASGPLDPEEFMAVVRKRDYGMKMCFERSAKKNPLLKVPKSSVDIRIGTSGKVTSVRISNIATTPLGQCLTKYIKRWKFRKTTEPFSGQFPLVFGR